MSTPLQVAAEIAAAVDRSLRAHTWLDVTQVAGEIAARQAPTDYSEEEIAEVLCAEGIAAGVPTAYSSPLR